MGGGGLEGSKSKVVWGGRKGAETQKGEKENLTQKVEKGLTKEAKARQHRNTG